MIVGFFFLLPGAEEVRLTDRQTNTQFYVSNNRLLAHQAETEQHKRSFGVIWSHLKSRF